MAKKKSSEKKSSTKNKDLAIKIEKDISQVIEKIAGSNLKKKIQEKKKKFPYLYITVIFIVLLGAVFAFALLRSPVAEIGDKVRVTYSGSFEDGENFGTDTIEFVLGENQVMKGLESNVYGMKEGSELKGEKVESRYCFGEHLTEKLEVMPAVYDIKKYIDMNLEELESLTDDNIQIGNTITIKNKMWFFKVTDVNRDFGEARLEQLPVLDSFYYNPLLVWWPIKVLNITESRIIIKHQPELGATIRKNENGNIIGGVVTNADEENIIVDYNYPNAGKICFFDIKLDKIFR
jgi:FKBP-type peptidyl-prolyl cis-trans isomerase 2